MLKLLQGFLHSGINVICLSASSEMQQKFSNIGDAFFQPMVELVHDTRGFEVIAFGEGVALAEKGGVAREVAVDAMLKSVVASPVLGYRGPFILEGNMPKVPLADVNLQQKDMQLVLELGRKMGVPVPLAAAANEMMNACRGLGIAHNDFVIAHEAYRILGGMSK